MRQRDRQERHVYLATVISSIPVIAFQESRRLVIEYYKNVPSVTKTANNLLKLYVLFTSLILSRRDKTALVLLRLMPDDFTCQKENPPGKG